jgi:uncharacterized protein YndB with AHSA1/START domain
MTGRRKHLAAISIAAIAASAGAAAAAPAPSGWSPNPATAIELSHGQAWAEVLPAPDGAGLIHAAIDIAAPPVTVWRIMTNCAYAQKLVVTVTSCKVLRSDPAGAWDIREQVTSGSFIIPEIHNIFRSDYQPYARIVFRKVGGDLKTEDGEWRLEPLNGGAGTRVIYINHIAANILAPAAMVREGMRRDTPKVLMNLRRECLARH